jgi:hypothetical protein
VILWQILYLSAHRLRRGAVRGFLGVSVLGNIVVILGWFGPNLFPEVHRYGAPGSLLSFVLVAVASNSAFFLIGLAPAGWLRLTKA